jgi:hypothetical protein
MNADPPRIRAFQVAISDFEKNLRRFLSMSGVSLDGKSLVVTRKFHHARAARADGLSRARAGKGICDTSRGGRSVWVWAGTQTEAGRPTLVAVIQLRGSDGQVSKG